MKTIPDETLMAYCDGELDALAAEDMRSALRTDPSLQERLRSMQAVDDLLRASVQVDLSVPDRFTNLLTSAQKEDPSNVVQLTAKNRTLRNWIPTGVGIAAAMLIVVGGNLMAPTSMAWLEQVEDGIALAGPVRQAIVTVPSGKHVQLNGLNVMPVVSFVSTDGRMCREAQLDDDEMAARIVACRDVAENEWCIEAFARMPSPQHKDGYYTASVPKDPVIDAAYARLGIKTTLTAAAEKGAIERNWSQTN